MAAVKAVMSSTPRFKGCGASVACSETSLRGGAHRRQSLGLDPSPDDDTSDWAGGAASEHIPER